MEIRNIPGYDGYRITDTGVVISRHGRPMSLFTDRDGYKRCSLAAEHGKDVMRKHIPVHRMVCWAFHGPAPSPEYEVRHLDSNPANNVPSNVCWATHLENIRDKYLHGTMPHGETHPMAKLTEEKVREIHFYFAMDYNNREIGEIFGVDNTTISCIRTGKTWRENAA